MLLLSVPFLFFVKRLIIQDLIVLIQFDRVTYNN